MDKDRSFAGGSPLPSIPEIADFAIRSNSSMSFLKAIFQMSGVTEITSRNQVTIGHLSKEQENGLRLQGIDVSSGKRMFPCSPRSFSRGF